MIRKLVERQQRWLADEQGTVRKGWGGRIRVALAFPNRYSVGMSNLGFQSVYGGLNALDSIVCERVFYPEPEDIPLLVRNPGSLISVESQRPLREFHLVAFSIPYENDYTNALEMLSFAGIPARAAERRPGHPIVAAGGVAIFLNPEPMADFLDLAFIGEAEALIPELGRLLEESGNRGREEILADAATREGVYVPSLYRPIYASDGTIQGFEGDSPSVPAKVRYRRADLADSAPCRTVILTPNTEFSSVTLVEIGRGCGRGCRFCAAGFVYRPVRYHSAGKLVAGTMPGMASNPRVGLVSAAVSDHPEVTDLCRTLLDAGGKLSFSSLRADTLTPEISSALESSRHQSVAIAPEAGSQRLRDVINKNITEEQICAAAEELTNRGVIHLKLYFMIGLPTETIDDLHAIVDLTKLIKHTVLKAGRGQKRLGTVTLSIHSFVPKPFTPFQWVPFAGTRELKERARVIRNALQKIPNVRVHFDLPKWAYIQALLSRGDRRVGAFLSKVAIDGNSWGKALRDVPHNPDFWVMRERREDEFFPWEIIDHGVRRSYLWEEYRRALEARLSPLCMPDENCRRCGACTP